MCLEHAFVSIIVSCVYIIMQGVLVISPSSVTCSLCPANSFGDRDGLAECICNTGFYRAPGEEDLPCRCMLYTCMPVL